MSLTFDCGFVHAGRRGFALELAFVTGEGITALCGPSGSGKTTAVHLIAGLLTPARGRIALGERVLFDAAAGVNLPPERRGLGIVFQDSLLFPHRSVAENLTYGLARRRATTPPAGAGAVAGVGVGAGVGVDFDRLVDLLELRALLERPPATLSGGQARRVALGRALLCSPALLILDEPFTGLDDDLKDRILEYLERVRDEWRIPMLLVSHERRTVARLAGRVVEIAATGRQPNELIGPAGL